MKTKIIIFFYLLCFSCISQNDSLYNAAIKKADAAYEFKFLKSKDDPQDNAKYQTARDLYQKALQIKPTATYPADRIKEIDKIFLEPKLISKADSFFYMANTLFDIGKFKLAAKFYASADSLYPAGRAKGKIMRTKKAYEISLKGMISLSTDASEISNAKYALNFLTTIQKADSLYMEYAAGLAGDVNELPLLTAAIVQYKKALEVNKDSRYANDRMKKIEEFQISSQDKNYQMQITRGNELFKLKDYSSAKYMYKEALKLKPNEEYPKAKIAEIEKLLKEK